MNMIAFIQTPAGKRFLRDVSLGADSLRRIANSLGDTPKVGFDSGFTNTALTGTKSSAKSPS